MISQIFLFAFVIFLLNFLWKKLNGTRGLPPGPFAWPIVGNLLQIDPRRPQRTCQQWGKKYGPVYTIWLAHNPAVIITDYEVMKEALVKNGDQLSGRPRNYVFEFFTHGNFGIVTATGELWKEQRRFSLQILKNFGFGRNIMEEKINVEAKQFVQSIFDEIDNANGREVVLDLTMHLQVCVANVISSILLGHTFDKDDPKFVHLKNTLDENLRLIASPQILLLNSFPWMRHLPFFNHFGMDIMREHHKIIQGFLTSELDQHKKELVEAGEHDEPTDFTAAYLKEMKRRRVEDEPLSYFSEWQLLSIMADLWIAGMETTVTTMRWGILAMMLHPEAQRKVHEEIDAVLGRDKTPCMNDRQSMPYVQAALNEIQRWANILPVNISHTHDADFQLAGYTIPKGVQVIPQISVMHINEKAFPAPDEFRPERFLAQDGKTLLKFDDFAPFSMGKRQCLGEGLARAELFLIFTAIMQKFRFSVSSLEKKPSVEPLLGITSSPQPYECLVTRR